jgi:hypothetical protein
MSDLHDPSILDVKAVPADSIEGGGSASPVESAADPMVAAQPGPDAVAQVEPAVESEDLQLLSRFLIGVALMGSDELMERLRFLQGELDADPDPLKSDAGLEQESELELLRYLSIGLFVRGREAVVGGVRRGVQLTLGGTKSVLGGVDRLTDNPLTRPLRRSVAARARDLGEKASVVIAEGRREEQKARLLADNTIGEIIDEVLDFVSESPEVEQLVQDMIGQQSAGLAGVVTDNARSVTVAGDYLIEGVARRLLRRKGRQELPPSPLAGEPQDMYAADTSETGGP